MVGWPGISGMDSEHVGRGGQSYPADSNERQRIAVDDSLRNRRVARTQDRVARGSLRGDDHGEWFVACHRDWGVFRLLTRHDNRAAGFRPGRQSHSVVNVAPFATLPIRSGRSRRCRVPCPGLVDYLWFSLTVGHNRARQANRLLRNRSIKSHRISCRVSKSNRPVYWRFRVNGGPIAQT